MHFELNVKNPKKTEQFYKKLFRWSIDSNNPMNYGLVKKGGKGGIGGGIGQLQFGQKPFVTFYVQVKDLKGTLRKVEKLGSKTIVPPTRIPNMVTLRSPFCPHPSPNTYLDFQSQVR